MALEQIGHVFGRMSLKSPCICDVSNGVDSLPKVQRIPGYMNSEYQNIQKQKHHQTPTAFSP